MSTRFLIIPALLALFLAWNGNAVDIKMKPLTPDEERVIVHKGTEKPFSGEYNDSYDRGTYACKRCGAFLFRSDSKFDAGCGWPSFDDEINGAVRRQTDADGTRTEIICAKCGAHLGHVFTGERHTRKNTRHCVNSISLKFIPEDASSIPVDQSTAPAVPNTESAVFAGGCFWGIEYYFERAKGVVLTQVGYTGGHDEHPAYKDVCKDTTGHAEAVRITYDPARTSYEEMAKLFFEIHDPTQVNRQGPDVGTQYRSVVFYQNEQQKTIVEKLIKTLKEKGYNVATVLVPAGDFWPAEAYHQHYYSKNGKAPYCHFYKKKF